MQTRSKTSVAPKPCSTTSKSRAPKPRSKSSKSNNDYRIHKKPPEQPVLAGDCPIRPVLPPKPVFHPLPTTDRTPQLHLPSTIDTSDSLQLFQLFITPEVCRYMEEHNDIYARRQACEKTVEQPCTVYEGYKWRRDNEVPGPLYLLWYSAIGLYTTFLEHGSRACSSHFSITPYGSGSLRAATTVLPCIQS